MGLAVPASLMKPGVVGGVSKWLPPPPSSPILFTPARWAMREREREREAFFFTYDDHDDLSLLFVFVFFLEFLNGG